MSHYEYKGYIGSAEVDTEASVCVGKLQFISDTITYSAVSPSELEKAFQEAVDEYLETCAELGSAPDVPFKGSFNVRVGPETHKKVALAAKREKVSLNEFVSTALVETMRGRDRTVNHIHHHEMKVVLCNGVTTGIAVATPRNDSNMEIMSGRVQH